MFVIAFVIVLVFMLSRLQWGGGFSVGGYNVANELHNAAGTQLGSVAGHDITAGTAASAAAAYYTGGAYGGMVSGGVSGGSEGMGAASSGAAGGAAYNDATSGGPAGPMAAPPRQWQASDDYGSLANDQAAWYYNAEQHAKANGGPGWTKDQYKFAQAQYDSQNKQKNNLASIDQWQQSRNPYYEAVYANMNKGYDAQSQQSYADSLKKMQLQHANRGTLGGSQSEFNKSQVNAQLAQEIAQNHQKSQEYVKGISGQDQQQAQNMRLQQYQEDPYLSAMYQSLLASQKQAGSQNGNLADLYMQGIQNSQNAQNSQSQIYGGQIAGLTGTAATAIGG